jgi:hypothetical protein
MQVTEGLIPFRGYKSQYCIVGDGGNAAKYRHCACTVVRDSLAARTPTVDSCNDHSFGLSRNHG